MLSYAQAEHMKDTEAMQRIRDAERADGFQTGMRFSDSGARLVQVTFYPERKWWITDTDVAGKPEGERRPLTREEFS